MSEQRFTIQKASGMYLHLPIFDNGVEMADGDVCILLNEQQATIDMQELRLQQLEELLELSENLNKSYREKLIDMNLKMVIDDE